MVKQVFRGADALGANAANAAAQLFGNSYQYPLTRLCVELSCLTDAVVNPGKQATGLFRMFMENQTLLKG